ncbi:MAG: DUF167 domain-containing protein [Candidatus Niyogibacteria bacterium]|nr:DUF167 domain-containing protein [Candidatus Niyogibacteria bacterium]
MKIFVNAKPNAHEAGIEKLDETHFIVSVKEPPIQGQANRAISDALSSHFGVGASRVRLVSGFASRRKVFEIG